MRDLRWRYRRLVAAATSAAALTAGCTPPPAADAEPITIGLIASLTGVYHFIGEDTRDGFTLYLDTHGGRLGGKPVDLVLVDEVDGGPDALAAATGTFERPDVVAVTGVTNAHTVTALLPALQARNAPLISSNGLARIDDVQSVWSTGFQPEEPGQALAGYLHDEIDGPVWAMASDNQSGHADVAGFVGAFASAGGRLANDRQEPLFTPGATNFLPHLSQAKARGARAVYASYLGAEAISFVQQYAQSDARDLPLFGAGFLTEGRVLAAQGRAAIGVRTVLNYAPDLDNPANRTFVDAWRARHNSLPTSYAMASWDAALLLDKALAAAGDNPGAADVDAAIAGIGLIDSPRGQWQFSDRHSPVQKWYLRRVQADGRTLTNSMIQDLDILGDRGTPS